MTLTELAPHADARVGGVHHDPASVPLRTLEERMEVLEHFAHPSVYGKARAGIQSDPRCGCSADNEGGRCDWDDLRTLEHARAVRLAAAA